MTFASRTASGETLELRDAIVVGDSIVGSERGESTSIPMAVALSGVASVDERKADAVGATFGVLLLFGSLAAVVELATWDCCL